jgi:hypothetical protein
VGGSDLIPRRDILIPRFVFRGPPHERLACQFAGHIAGDERQPPFARVRRLPAECSFRQKLDEAAFLELGKGTLRRSARIVASLGSPTNGQPNLAVVPAVVESRDLGE